MLMVEVTALRAYANFLIARVPKVATAFSGSPLDAVSICLVVVLLVLSTMHKKLRQKLHNLCVQREFNSVDYSAFLYGLCNRPCHDK